MIHTVKGFGIINKADVDVFLEFSCFFYNPMDVCNMISDSSAILKSSLYIWKFSVHVLLKPGLDHFEHYFHWMKSVFISVPKKGSAKEYLNYHTTALISHGSKVTLKILQARLQQYVNHELTDSQADFRKGQRSNCQHLLDHRKSKRTLKKHLLLLHWLH